MKFDLHVHTNYSDGNFTPSEVVDLAFKRGLNGIAISDHDTVLGVSEAIDRATNYKEFKVIPGIELGCIYADEEVHILGYFIDYNSENLLKSTDTLRKNRVLRGKKIIDKLKNLNIDITYDEVQALSKDDFIGRVHIAKVLVNKDYVKSISEAFELFLNKDAPAYVLRETLSIKESINLINKAKGIAVLAHPGILKNKNEIINYCIEQGIQGIECIHSKHSVDDSVYFKRIALENNLLVTAGSDCHGQIINDDLLLGKYSIDELELSKLEEMI
nr:PHP domain-containing protein [Tissierella sp.]